MHTGKKKKKLDFEHGAADPTAPNLAHVNRLVRNRSEDARGGLFEDGRKRVGGTPVVVAVVEIGLAVILICSALGDRVDNGTGGTTVFGGIIGRIDLELLDSRLRR